MPFESIDPYDFFAPNNEDRQTKHRRMFMYSVDAIRAAVKLERVFVNHSAARDALHAMDRVYQLGRDIGLPQGVILMGPPGSGKSTLFSYFSESLPKEEILDSDCRVIAIRLQKRPSLSRIVATMLKQIRYPLPATRDSNVSIKKDLLLEGMRQKGSRLILIDEAHHLFGYHNRKSACNSGNEITDLIRESMDVTSAAVVLAGSTELDDLDSFDAHLAGRITARIQLKNYGDDATTWAGVVGAIVRDFKEVDLKGLVTPAGLASLNVATSGNLRSLKRILTEAVMIVIDEAKSSIDTNHLALAFERVRGVDCPQSNPYAR